MYMYIYINIYIYMYIYICTYFKILALENKLSVQKVYQRLCEFIHIERFVSVLLMRYYIILSYFLEYDNSLNKKYFIIVIKVLVIHIFTVEKNVL